jgi:hypothetical protein
MVAMLFVALVSIVAGLSLTLNGEIIGYLFLMVASLFIYWAVLDLIGKIHDER